VSKIINLDDATFEEVLQANELVLVDFGAEWCHPCKQLDPIIEELAEEWDGIVKVCKLDTAVNINSIMKYRIMSIPTLILFKKGIEVKHISGTASRKRILDTFIPYIGVEK
jgi:thioredoxin 1